MWNYFGRNSGSGGKTYDKLFEFYLLYGNLDNTFENGKRNCAANQNPRERCKCVPGGFDLLSYISHIIFPRCYAMQVGRPLLRGFDLLS